MKSAEIHQRRGRVKRNPKTRALSRAEYDFLFIALERVILECVDDNKTRTAEVGERLSRALARKQVRLAVEPMS